jgi:hypothetical protein
MSARDDDDDALVLEPLVQRQVSALDAETPAVVAAVANSAFAWRGHGNAPDTLPPEDQHHEDTSAPAPAISLPKEEVRSPFLWHGRAASAADTTDVETDTPADEPQPQPEPGPANKETPMATKVRNGAARSRKTARGSPQLQICSVLLQEDMSLDELSTALPKLSRSQIYSALNNAKVHRRISGSGSSFTLTDTGRKWVQAAIGDEVPVTKAPAPNPAKKAAATPAPTPTPAPSPATELVPVAPVDTSPTLPPQRALRFAMDSDGNFWITKNGVVITLAPDEYARLEQYQKCTHMLRTLDGFGVARS